MSTIDSKLLHEICTINTSNQHLVGQITKIFPDKFAVKIINFHNKRQLLMAKEVEIRIETLDNEMYFYVAYLESQHVLESNQIVFFKPISHIHDNNKRKYKRLKVDAYLSPIKISFRHFPPKDLNWDKVKLIDISEGGMMITSRFFYSKGLLMETKLGTPFFDKPQLIVCRIIHSKEEYGDYNISLQFVNISDEQKQSIASYIENAHERIKSMSDSNPNE